MLELTLILVVVLPLAWLASEFHPSRTLRITLGILAIGMSFGVASVVGSLERLQSNTYFATATKDLIQNTIVELENDKCDRVLAGLLELRAKFRPTYETRDDYDKLVDEYIASISDDPIQHEPGVPGWSHEMAQSAPTEDTNP